MTSADEPSATPLNAAGCTAPSSAHTLVVHQPHRCHCPPVKVLHTLLPAGAHSVCSAIAAAQSCLPAANWRRARPHVELEPEGHSVPTPWRLNANLQRLVLLPRCCMAMRGVSVGRQLPACAVLIPPVHGVNKSAGCCTSIDTVSRGGCCTHGIRTLLQVELERPKWLRQLSVRQAASHRVAVSARLTKKLCWEPWK